MPGRYWKPLTSMTLVGALASACAMTTVTPSGRVYPPRESKCRFEVFTKLVPPGYVEIATVDVNPGAYGINAYKNLGEFQEAIRSDVCKAGGDAVLAQADGFGNYLRATVLHRADHPTAGVSGITSPVSSIPSLVGAAAQPSGSGTPGAPLGSGAAQPSVGVVAPAPSTAVVAPSMGSEAVPSGASVVSPVPAAVRRGCEYDTQCKGDRICVKGECVSP